MHKCSNGRSLLITDIESIEKELNPSWIPYVVLLTAWSIEMATVKILNPLIKFLLARGTKTFVCLGDYSEQLHDEIDEIIYEYDEERGTDVATKVLTTYHADETIDDAVNYFVHGTELPDPRIGGLLALIGARDYEVKRFLEIT